MSKVLAVIRSSSERQETESQKLEMIQFCKEKGFNEDEIEIIEVAGASARKLNKKYIQMLEDIKSTIINNNIKVVAFWHLNRLGRNEVKLTEMKEFFKQNKIQVYIKYPSIQLLNDDGTLNEGANISWSVFAVMVEKDTEEMFAKMLRGRKRNSETGKSNGGIQKFGFTVDENDMVVINEEEAEVVKLVFNLYATGKYSASTLHKELTERGYNLKKWFVLRTLENTAYIGYTDYNDSRRSHRKYPRIISDELYNKCKDIRLKQNTAIEKTKQYHFAIKLLKCNECGYNYIVNGGVYHCWVHKLEKKCSNNLSINQKNLDWCLWYVAKNWHIQYVAKMNAEMKDEYIEQIKVLEQKIAATQQKSKGIEEKIQKVVDNYVDGFYTKKQRDERVKKIKKEDEENQNQIINYKEQIEKLHKAIDIASSINPLSQAIDEHHHQGNKLTLEQMKEIVQLQVGKIDIDEIEVKNRKGYKITIIAAQPTASVGRIEFIYFANNKQNKFYIIKKDGELKEMDTTMLKYANEYWLTSGFEYMKRRKER